MAADFPWSVLGLDGPGTEAEIRRAYARKLKVTRPDENPEVFQALVQAREIALGITSGEITIEPIDEPEVALAPSAAREEAKPDSDKASAFTFAPQETEPDQTPSDEESVREKLRRQPTIWETRSWQQIADLVGKLSFASRQRIEWELLQALSELDWEKAARSKPFGAILLSLSEEYGWEHDSVKLVRLFGDQLPAGIFHDLLAHMRGVAEGKIDVSARFLPEGEPQEEPKPAQETEPEEFEPYYHHDEKGGGRSWAALASWMVFGLVIIIFLGAMSVLYLPPTRHNNNSQGFKYTPASARQQEKTEPPPKISIEKLQAMEKLQNEQLMRQFTPPNQSQ